MYDSMYCRQNVESESEIERTRELRRAREAERGGECGRLISLGKERSQKKILKWIKRSDKGGGGRRCGCQGEKIDVVLSETNVTIG